jgi:acylglycerol lipase
VRSQLSELTLAHGRWSTPIGSIHYPQLRDDPEVQHTFRRVFLRPYSDFSTWQEAYDSTAIIHSEQVEITPEELKSGVARGGRWVFYSTWEMKEPLTGWEGGGRGRGRDLVMIHGE